MFEHVNGAAGQPSEGSATEGAGQGWGSGIEGPLRLLLIEPDDRHRRDLATSLRACGPPVHLTEASGFLSGLASLRVDRFACVLVSRDLPDGDPLAFVGLVRNTEASTTPLIFVLDDEDQDFESAAQEAGAEDTILRAAARDRDLRRTIRGAVARSRLKSELGRANARLERIAVNEPLTGLLNRRGLDLALKREQALGLRKGVDNHVLLVDLDDFKRVNDGYGYDVGDRMLQEVARALEETVRRTDHVARIGGDEFLVLMPDSKLAAGLRLAERIRARLEAIRIRTSKGTLSVRASLGVSRLPAEARSVTELVAEVGGAVHRSKRRGKNRVSLDAELHSQTTGKLRTLAREADVDLHRAVYLAQPIAHLGNDDILAHWVMSPGTPQIGHALDAGSSLPVHEALKLEGDRRQLAGAVEASRDHDDGCGFYFFSVHPLTLVHTPSPRLKALFGPLEDAPGWGVMIGDDHLLGDPAVLIEPVERLREAGIGLGIRQVGFSRDSLEAVVLLRPRLVTLRLAHLLGPRRELQRVGMIRRLVRTLSCVVPDVVLEGIVTEEDRQLATDLGIRYGVGSGVGDVVVLTDEEG